jgi:hypothetical protein
VDVAQPGRAISRDISRGEAVEAEINCFITKRHNERVARGEGERLAEEAWKASERRQVARRRAEVKHARLAWHRRLEIVYAVRSEEHGRIADALEGEEATQPKGAA